MFPIAPLLFGFRRRDFYVVAPASSHFHCQRELRRATTDTYAFPPNYFFHGLMKNAHESPRKPTIAAVAIRHRPTVDSIAVSFIVASLPSASALLLQAATTLARIYRSCHHDEKIINLGAGHCRLCSFWGLGLR